MLASCGRSPRLNELTYREEMASEAGWRSGIPPDNFTGWVVEPMPFDDDREISGKRTKFSDYTYHGSPTVVGRFNYAKVEDGCVAHTKDPVPVGKAWRISLMKRTDVWRRGLTIGLTTTVSSKAPGSLSHIVDEDNYFYELPYIPDKSEKVSRTGTLPHNWDISMSDSAALYLTAEGELHLYCDEEYARHLASGLPVHKPLWGAVDVFGNCVQLKSELLIWPDEEKLRSLYHADVNAPTILTCFNSKPVEVTVPPSEEVTTVAPHSLGIVVKVPPNPPESQLTISFRTCSMSQNSAIFPPATRLSSLIFHISTKPPVENEMEIIIEHNATSKQEKNMVFFVGEQSRDGSQKVKFTPKTGKFDAKKQHGSLTTSQLGFLSIGTTQPSKMKKCYVVLCCYSNGRVSPKQVAIAISPSNQEFTMNFRRNLQKEWDTSVTCNKILDVEFKRSVASLKLPSSLNGWKLVADTSDPEFAESAVDCEIFDNFDYPPRKYFTVEPMENAVSCDLKLSVTGLNKDVCFKVPLEATYTSSSAVKQNAPNIRDLQSFRGISIIDETAHFSNKISSILLDDRYGHHVDSIKGTGAEKIREIYEEWIDSEQDYCSWETLCDCYRQCQLGDLADRIENYIYPPTPATPASTTTSYSSIAQNVAFFPDEEHDKHQQDTLPPGSSSAGEGEEQPLIIRDNENTSGCWRVCQCLCFPCRKCCCNRRSQ